LDHHRTKRKKSRRRVKEYFTGRAERIKQNSFEETWENSPRKRKALLNSTKGGPKDQGEARTQRVRVLGDVQETGAEGVLKDSTFWEGPARKSLWLGKKN